MLDLTQEAAQLWESLGEPSAGKPLIVQFIAARSGEGASTVAREFARFTARLGRRTWLVDLDLANQTQHQTLRGMAGRLGELGPAVTASPDGSTFLAITPATEGLPGAAYLAAHKVGAAPWWVTRLRSELISADQRTHVLPRPDYWNALREHAEIIVVDSPSLSRSEAGLAVAPHMDRTILVLAADQNDAKAPLKLRDALSQVGGKAAGLFYNRAKVEPPAFLKSLLA